MITKKSIFPGKNYGYCRISTKKQSMERQIRNIKQIYPDAIILQESFTGTKMDRPEWNKLYRKVGPGDTIIFDSVSRMSRTAEEGFECYQALYNRNINLVFLKEPHVNTDSYKNALEGIISTEIKVGDTATEELINAIMDAVNKFMMQKVRDDILKAFEQSEKEVKDLQQRTKEGIETARLNGKQIGAVPGRKLVIKKKAPAKEKILMYSRNFNGNLPDRDCMKVAGVSKNTFYKYKKEIKNEN